MKSKKIVFQPVEEYADVLLNPPSPASNNIPKWFKDQNVFSNNTTDYLKATKMGNNIFTYKLCVPITDTITSGYTIVLPADVLVTNIGSDNDYRPMLNWNVSFPVADIQPSEALANYPVPTGFSSTFYRWNHDWNINTPKGYSSFFMHPLHRHDLPFFTISGIVDTDMFPNKLHLPFFIKNGFEGIIKEGTPIAQFLPFKRDSWESEKKSFSKKSKILYDNAMKINFLRTYKNKIWSKKVYK
jgi:hypothetical protein